MYFPKCILIGKCILNRKKREERGKHSRGRGTWAGPVVCDRVSLRGRRREKDEKHTRGRKHRAKCVLGHGWAPQGPHASTSHCRKPPSRLPPPALIVQHCSTGATVSGVQFYCSGVLLFYCSTATAVPGEPHMGPDTVLSRESYWSAVPGAQFYCSAVLLFYWSYSAWCAVLQFYCSTVLLQLQCLVSSTWAQAKKA